MNRKNIFSIISKNDILSISIRSEEIVSDLLKNDFFKEDKINIKKINSSIRRVRLIKYETFLDKLFDSKGVYHGDKYYNAFNKLKELEKEKNITKASYQKYEEIAENLRSLNNWKELNLSHLDSQIEQVNTEIEKPISYKENLRKKPKTLEKEEYKIDILNIGI